MTKLNFLSTVPFLLAGALVGLTLSACDFGPKMIGDETQGALNCEDGETKPAEDGCNTCSCADGEWACTEKACEGQSSAPAECNDGDMMPAPDGCNSCSCFEGNWACTQIGCDPTTGGWDTDDPGTSTVATSQTSDTDGTGDTGGEEPPPVIPCDGEAVPLADITTIMAYSKDQVPPMPPPDTTSTGTSTTGGGELDPGTIIVTLTDQPLVCADPEALLQCGGHWQVTIVIPPEFQSPGTYNLLGQDVHGFATETGDGGGQDCSVGGGSFDATFQIFSVDDNTVEGRLCHVDAFFSVPTPSLEGSFSAPRCQ
jgi:hypothetical protein